MPTPFAFFAKYKNTIALIGLLFLAFAFYGKGIIAVPRADHKIFMQEREYYANDTDFFLNAISLTRTRHLRPGDFFLFRPGFHALLAGLDIFFRSNLFIVGALSIVWHALVAWTIFLAGSRLLNFYYGVFFAVLFAAQFPGMEMVLWRHISGYMIGLIFFGLALFYLLKGQYPQSSGYPAVIGTLVFLSMLFHELFALAAPFTGAIILSARKKFSISPKRVVGIFIIPACVYLLLDILDYFVHAPGHFFGSVDHAPTLWQVVENVISVAGVFLSSFVFPWLVELTKFGGRARLDYQHFPYLLLIACGITFWTIILAASISIFRPRNASSEDPRSVSLLFLIVGLVVLVAGLAIGRVSLRGAKYLGGSTYYFYFSSYFLIFALMYLTERYRPSRIPIVIFCCYLLYVNFIGLRSSIEKAITPDDIKMANVAILTSKVIAQKGVCFGGSVNRQFEPVAFHYRQSCERKSGRPLFLMMDNDKIVKLVDAGEAEELVPKVVFPTTLTDEFNLRVLFYEPPHFSLNDNYLRGPTIEGQWSIAGKPCDILRRGADNFITLVNEHNDKVPALLTAHVIHAPDWNVEGIISPDLSEIRWTNGSIWRR